MTEKKSTIYTVAEHAGVSIATVSRTLAGSRRVAPETRERIMKAIEALNYAPNPSARRLASQSMETIALVFPDISGPFYSTVIRGVEQAAGRYEHNVLIYGTHGKEGSGRYLRTLTSKVDGLIIMARSIENDTLTHLKRRGIPFVLLSRSNGDLECDTVAVDNEAGASEAVSHLLEHGHQRIGLITGPDASPDNRERVQGYQKSLVQAGLSLPAELVQSGNFQYESGRAAMTRLFEGSSPPTAVLAANDEMAMGAMDVALQKGKHIPSDLAVIGFDDIQMAAMTRPSLTTVRQPMELLGETAVKLLFHRLDRGDAPFRHIVLPTSLVLRQSCGCAVSASPRS